MSKIERTFISDKIEKANTIDKRLELMAEEFRDPSIYQED